jgi:guanosine-3',5'-bis(diphosphate) 3'-pyrophosphohydrolase
MPMSSEQALPLILRALHFAANKHRMQRRKDAEASPYINHPIALAETLSTVGVTDPATLAAAILHDVIEDTDTSPDEIEAAFGADIRHIVMEVTDDKSLPKERRKQLQIDHAASASMAARLVKLADKICNVRDILESPPQGWSLTRRGDYLDWARQVIDSLRGTHPVLEARFDELYRLARQQVDEAAR